MRQNVLEPAQELGNSFLAKMVCATQCFRFLLLVVEIGAQGMMRIVSLSDEIGDGELDSLSRLSEPVRGGRRDKGEWQRFGQ